MTVQNGHFPEELFLAVDIIPGPAQSEPKNIIQLGNKLYFSADDGTGSGSELSSYDGISVTRLTDINPGPDGSSIAHPAALDGILYFTANDGTHGERELFKYDPGTGIASLLADINGTPDPSYAVSYTHLRAHET